MAKLTLTDLANLNNDNTVIATLNANNANIETAMENTLSRDGTTPNAMGANLDMNSWHILNLPEPSSDTDPVRLIDLTNVSQVTNVLHTASSTSNSIGLGTKTFTVPSGLGFFVGQFLLIQDALNTANYMVARVTSYSGSTLVVNAISSAGSGTKTNWTIDLSGPQGPVTVEYDTVVNASAATIDPTVTFLKLAGYYNVGDGGDGLYKRVLSTPAHAGYFTSAGGAIWELNLTVVTPEMFGCKGDGLTNDYQGMQNALSYNTIRGGGTLSLTSNKVYRVAMSDATTPDLGLVVGDNNTILLNGSRINLENAGFLMGIRMKSHTRMYGPGTVALTVATGVAPAAYQFIFQSLITMGTSLGDTGTVANPSPFVEVHDIVIDGVTLSSTVGTNYGCTAICGNGGMYDIIIRNCKVLDSATLGRAFDFEWAPIGNIDSGDIALSRVNYDAGTAYSVHPHDILLENNEVGTLSLAYNIAPPNVFGSSSFHLSGCYGVTIQGNDVESTTYTGIFNTGGDESFEFAPPYIRLNACKNMVFRNNNFKNVTSGIGIYTDSYPDNVYNAVVNPANPSYPYSPYGVVTGYPANNLIEGNRIICTSGAPQQEGMIIGFTSGLVVRDNMISGFKTGIRLTASCANVLVEGNDISLCNLSGILCGDSSLFSLNCSFIRNKVYRNCTLGSSTLGNITVDGTVNNIVADNFLGFGEDQALNGIVITDSNTSCTCTGNTVYAVKAGGIAYKMPTSNTAGLAAIWVFRDNYFTGTGAGSYLTGLSIIPYRRDLSVAVANKTITHAQVQRAALTAGLTPSYGAWEVGSSCTLLDAAVGQAYLVKCTVAGSPGTWNVVALVS